MIQKLAEVGTHEVGHQSDFVEDKTLREQDFFEK